MDNSKPQSLFPLEQCPQVSDEAFNIFHSVDRELFTRLIFNLGRDPSLCMQVAAFFIWLEKQSKDMVFIKRVLSLPLLLLNELVDEAAICLKCAESETYPFLDSDVVISLLPDILNNPVVSVRYFHENRAAMLKGVSKIVDTVCVRAFQDIVQRKFHEHLMSGSRVPPFQYLAVGNVVVGESSRMAERNEIGGNFGVGPMGPLPPRLPHPPGLLFNPYLAAPFGQPPCSRGTGVMIPMLPPPPPPRGVLPNVHLSPPVHHVNQIPVRMTVPRGVPPVYDSEVQSQLVGEELMQMLDQDVVVSNREEVSNVNNVEQVEEEQVAVAEEVAADDRTIFLTFSKGYPVTEDEVREFFTKRFGNFFEELVMQEVAPEEQVLFARMVVKPDCLASIRAICGNNRIKYSINGKHVHARKYVKKPQGSSSRSSRQTSRNTEEQT